MEPSFRFELWEGWRGVLYTLLVTGFIAGAGCSLGQPFIFNVLAVLAIFPQFIYLAYRNRTLTAALHALLWVVVCCVALTVARAYNGQPYLTATLTGDALLVQAQKAHLHPIPAPGLNRTLLGLLLINGAALVSGGLIALNMLFVSIGQLTAVLGTLIHLPGTTLNPLALLPYLWLRLAGGLFISVSLGVFSIRVALRLPLPWAKVMGLWAVGLTFFGASVMLEQSSNAAFLALATSLQGVTVS